jgi:flagellar motility protein MotE (MotC chaperone)
MRPRILPMLILVATLTLGVRVGEIWQGFGGIATADPDAASGADFVADPFASLQLAQATPESEADAEGTPAEGADTAADAPAQNSEPAGQGGARDLLASADPLDMTEAEIELLQQLAKRREKLEQRADTLDRRESLVKAAEKRLTEKVDEMERLRSEIEDLLVKYDEQESKQLTRLVNIYEKMKPKDAARIFEDLDQDVLLKVVERMNERKTAPILAEMRPDKAQQLTIELAERVRPKSPNARRVYLDLRPYT